MNIKNLTARWNQAGLAGALGLAAAACLLTSCSSPDPNPTGRFAFPDERQDSPSKSYSDTILPGDQIVVTFSDTDRPLPQLLLSVPETGVLTLPFDVHVQASGKTTTQLEKDIRDAYVPSLFVKLTASVKPERRAFFVDGEVKSPGRLEYFGKMTVLRAVSTAGGFTDFANRKKIEVHRGSQKFIVNWFRALDHYDLDLPVFPGDHIVVRRTIGLW